MDANMLDSLAGKHEPAASGDGTASTDCCLAVGRGHRPDAALRAEQQDRFSTFSAYYRQALALLQQQQFASALACLDRALEERPDVAEAHDFAGIALLSLGRPADAIVRFKKVLALKPKSFVSRTNIGVALVQLKQYAEAIRHFTKVLSIAPQHVPTLHLQGVAHASLGRHEKACIYFRRALAISADLPAAHLDLGASLEQLERPEEALDCYDRAIAIDPRFAKAYNNKCVLLRQFGRLEEARRAAEAAIGFAPEEMRAHHSYSLVHHYEPGDPHLATLERLAAVASAWTPEAQTDLRFALAKALGDVARFDEAFDQLAAAHALLRARSAYDERSALDAFDRIRTTFTAQLLRSKQGLGHPSPVPIFVVGMPRSGTTLIEQILARHPAVFGAGERKDLPEAVLDHIARQRSPLAFPELAQLLTQRQLDQIGANYVKALQTRAPSAARIVDKLPSNFLMIGLIRLVLPNAHIIHVSRDPLDTCFSMFSMQFVEDFPFAHDLGELGRYYSSYRSLMSYWREVLPRNTILEVRYEDVVADLPSQTRRILAHCGLEWNDDCLDFHKADRIVLTASAAQVRRPIYKSSIGRWRAYEADLGPLIAALGAASPTARGEALGNRRDGTDARAKAA